MRLRPLAALILACGAALAGSGAWPQTVVADAPAQAREVRAWLMRIHDAASHRNFSGTFVVSGGGSVSSARIAHYCEGASQFERSESLDGQARHVYRHNEVVTTVWPNARVAMVEQRSLLAQFPALLQAGDDRIADHYELRPQGSGRVAGHEANVLWVKPRDGFRYGYRLWADQGTGLLLRADVIGEGNDVLETSAFSDVTIDVRPRPESVLQPMKKLDGYRVIRPVLTPTSLDAEGWALRRPAPGFTPVSCVKRPMENSAEDRNHVADPQVLQAIYSDGLSYVSVFIEPFQPQLHVRPMLTSVGSTRTLMLQQGDWWVTVMGDVPLATVRLFAYGLERSRK
jgi:sigma-E factor negative regulatory protein RseB